MLRVLNSSCKLIHDFRASGNYFLWNRFWACSVVWGLPKFLFENTCFGFLKLQIFACAALVFEGLAQVNFLLYCGLPENFLLRIHVLQVFMIALGAVIRIEGLALHCLGLCLDRFREDVLRSFACTVRLWACAAGGDKQQCKRKSKRSCEMCKNPGKPTRSREMRKKQTKNSEV